MHLRRQLHLIMLTGTDQQIPRLDPVTAAPLVRVEEADHRRQPRTLHRLREIRVLIQRLRTHDRTTSRPNYSEHLSNLRIAANRGWTADSGAARAEHTRQVQSGGEEQLHPDEEPRHQRRPLDDEGPGIVDASAID